MELYLLKYLWIGVTTVTSFSWPTIILQSLSIVYIDGGANMNVTVDENGCTLRLAGELPVCLVDKINVILTSTTDRGRKLTSPNTIYNTWEQGCIKSGSRVARLTKFCTVTPNTCGFSVWNWYHVTFLALTISGWLLNPWLRETVLAPWPLQSKNTVGLAGGTLKLWTRNLHRLRNALFW